MRILRASLVAAAVLVAAAAVAAAQTPAPTVTVTANATSVTAAPSPVAPGATRFDFVNSDERAEISVYLAAVKRGYTADEVISAIRTQPEESFVRADIVASVSLTPGARRAVTAAIEPNRTYLLVNDGGQENPANWVISQLATGGAPTGATAPSPDAEVVLRDLRFLGDGRLPREGTIRVTNAGWAPHFAIAFPLRRGARPAAVSRALLRNRERAFGRLVNFRNTVEVTNILTRGAEADQEITFNRRGRYVLVCFFEEHNTQGMFRFVRVR
jgi:hypothetical protein